MMGPSCRALILSVVATIAMAAQAPGPVLRILDPTDEDYVSGRVKIRAAMDPAGTVVKRMQFFCDGQLVRELGRPPFECDCEVGAEVHAHAIRVVAVLADGRETSATVRTKGLQWAESVDVARVQVTAVVLDHGRFVQGLRASAFHVYEDDAPRKIEQFSAQSVGLDLIVAVDISESMTDAIGQMKELVKRFLTGLRPDVRVTLLAFNENHFVLSHPSSTLPERLEAVDTLAPWGATALHGVIVRAFGMLSSDERRRGVVVFTDGDDNSSRISAQAVERQAETSDAVLFMIGQGRAISSAPLKSLCEHLAEKSGGRAFFPRRIEDLREVFDQISEELSNQYYFTFSPRSEQRDGAYHRIRVAVDGGYDVRARSGYRWELKGQR